jgi:hypothetical protein
MEFFDRWVNRDSKSKETSKKELPKVKEPARRDSKAGLN